MSRFILDIEGNDMCLPPSAVKCRHNFAHYMLKLSLARRKIIIRTFDIGLGSWWMIRYAYHAWHTVPQRGSGVVKTPQRVASHKLCNLGYHRTTRMPCAHDRMEKGHQRGSQWDAL